jgi:hypothetical protein
MAERPKAKMTPSPRHWGANDPQFWEKRALETQKMLVKVERRFSTLDREYALLTDQRRQLKKDLAEAEAKAVELGGKKPVQIVLPGMEESNG